MEYYTATKIIIFNEYDIEQKKKLDKTEDATHDPTDVNYSGRSCNAS
jgi:hypothetical protein